MARRTRKINSRRKIVRSRAIRSSRRTTRSRTVSKRSTNLKGSANNSASLALTNHDEEKLLLMTSGLLLGIGLSVSLFFDKYWYGGLVAVALGVIFLLIEKRQ